MWAAAVKDDATKVKVMQMIVDQLSAAQQWADKGGQEDTHAQLVALARQCASGCGVVGQHQKLAELARLGTSANTQLNPQNFRPTDKVGPIVDPIVKQILEI